MQVIIKVEIRPYQHKDLYKLFKMSKTKFNRELKPFRAKLGKRIGNTWNIRQVEKIMQFLGHPYIIVGE